MTATLQLACISLCKLSCVPGFKLSIYKTGVKYQGYTFITNIIIIYLKSGVIFPPSVCVELKNFQWTIDRHIVIVS